MSLFGFIVASSIAVSGCATQQDAQQAMAGMTRADVLACAGAPSREAQDGNLTVMSYSNFRAIDGTAYSCDASITFRGGVVDTVRYRGARGVCSAILRGCKPSG